MSWRTRAYERRAERTIERQLDFMRRLSESFRGREDEKNARLKVRAERLREKITRYRPIGDDDRILEVGSGASGYIFHLGAKNAVGVDPLADHLRELFPLWQTGVETIAASGEDLPFQDESFDVVISDNVIDHAENPGGILKEITRVLRPGGMFYFTVHVHHPLYHAASTVYGVWNSFGLPPEITPFADHTVHLTPRSARRLFAELPFRIEWEGYSDEPLRPPRHLGDRLKRLFYKNRTWEVIALKQRNPAAAA